MTVPRGASACWLWEIPRSTTTIVRFAQERGVREVFVNGAVARAGDQCAALGAAGVASSCLVGDPSWALDHRSGLAVCRAALRRTRCTALHLDVEPWVLPEWSRDLARLADGYAGFVEACAREFPGVRIDVDVVPWLFDVAPESARRVLRAASSMTALAYRDRAAAIGEFAAPAIAAARELGRDYRIGVETMPVGLGVPAHVTFADDGATVLNRELALLDSVLSADRRYRGVAVHHCATWRSLRG